MHTRHRALLLFSEVLLLNNTISDYYNTSLIWLQQRISIHLQNTYYTGVRTPFGAHMITRRAKTYI